jgi:hypothetical protein
MISACVLIFLGLVAFIFWLGTLAEHAAATAAPVSAPRGFRLADSSPSRLPGD